MKKILFKKSIKIEIDKLPPSWKPQIFIDRRILERLERKSVDLEPKFSETVDKHFWNLV